MAKTTELTIPEAFQIGEIAVNKEVLLQRVEEACRATITGINDTAGYKAAISHRASFRTVRTTLEKVRKEMSAPHQAFVKQLKERTDELGAIASKGEIYFDDLITAIDNEKERLRKEKEAQEQAKINGRIHQLFELGAKFDGENYTFGYDESLFITPLQLKQEGDGAFADFIGDVNDAYNKEQERIEDELIIQQAKETAERLQREQDENDRLEREAELARQTEVNQLEASKLVEKRTLLRRKEINLMGFKDEKDGYYHHAKCASIFKGVLETVSEEEWDTMLSDLQYDIENYVEITEDDWMRAEQSETIIASGNPVQDPEQGYLGNEMQSEAEPVDYSLNDFESLTKNHYKGSKAHKKIILDAVASYKEAMDNF